MRIVHICLSGLYMDGWGYQDNMLAKYHVRLGHEVTVIANEFMYDHEGNYVKIDNEKYMQPETDRNGVRVVRLKTKGEKILKGPAERVHYEGLYDSLARIKPDVIFLHNPQIMDTEDIVRFMKEHSSARLYVDSHSDYSNSGRNFISKHFLHGGLWRSKVGKLIPYTEKFYGVLPARVDFMLDRYKTSKEKTELLVMGMDDELSEKAADPKIVKATREKLQLKKDDFLIVTGGKIDSAKRQTLLLIDAVINLKNKGADNIKLLIFGSVADDMKEEVRSKADGDTVKYIGWIEADDTYPYFAAADLAIFPGRHSVMWEQVAGQGIPMIVKYWEGTTHVDLGGNVKFLYKDSVEEIEAVIKNLSDRGEEYRYMKESAETKGKTVFSYRQIAKRCIGQND